MTTSPNNKVANTKVPTVTLLPDGRGRLLMCCPNCNTPLTISARNIKWQDKCVECGFTFTPTASYEVLLQALICSTSHSNKQIRLLTTVAAPSLVAFVTVIFVVFYINSPKANPKYQESSATNEPRNAATASALNQIHSSRQRVPTQVTNPTASPRKRNWYADIVYTEYLDRLYHKDNFLYSRPGEPPAVAVYAWCEDRRRVAKSEGRTYAETDNTFIRMAASHFNISYNRAMVLYGIGTLLATNQFTESEIEEILSHPTFADLLGQG